MQQMHEPEGQRRYGEGYQARPDYSTYEEPRTYGEYAEQAERSYSRYDSSEADQRQKLDPSSQRTGAIRAMAILTLVFSSIIMGFSIALFTMSIIIANNLPTSGEIASLSIVSLVFSILVMVLAIASFVFSLVLLILLSKRFKWNRLHYGSF